MIGSRYRGLDELWANPPDALIVTGTEPAQVQLPYEPYWPYLARLLEWAATSVPTTLLSCLAAHASLLLFDGIERVPRPVKCSGVFRGVVADASRPAGARPARPRPGPPLAASTTCRRRRLIEAGYRIVIGCGPVRRRLGGGGAQRRATGCSCCARGIPSTAR